MTRHLELEAEAEPGMRLPDHVRACECDGQVILLDLIAGRYCGVPQNPGLAQAIAGWPATSTAPRANVSDAGVQRLAQRLAQQHLIERRPLGLDGARTIARCSAKPHFDAATHSLDVDTLATAATLDAGTAALFLHAAAATHLALAFRSLASIADTVARRRRRLEDASTPKASLASAVARYTRLRPLVFTTRDRCLFDSLALLHFLTRQGLTATWIVGVRTRPFAAHAWLQSGPLVLNDHHDHVGQFRPILVV